MGAAVGGMQQVHDQAGAESADQLSPQYPQRRLSRWERWATDETGQPIVEFDAEAHSEWCAKWAPPCPVGNPQRLRRALGFRERNVAELELRVPLSLSEPDGACQIIVDERDDQVYVRVLVCYEDEGYEDEEDVRPRRREYLDCPVGVSLDRPLGDRAVIDVDDDLELPLSVSKYLNNSSSPSMGITRPIGDADPGSRSTTQTLSERRRVVVTA